MSKRLQLLIIGVFGLVAAYAYFQWLLRSGTHTSALRAHGEAGYWALLSIPVVVLSPLFAIVGARSRRIGIGVVLASSILVAAIIAAFGLFGEWLICVVITRGACE